MNWKNSLKINTNQLRRERGRQKINRKFIPWMLIWFALFCCYSFVTFHFVSLGVWSMYTVAYVFACVYVYDCWRLTVGRIHACVCIVHVFIMYTFSVRDGFTTNDDRKCIGMCAGGLVAVCVRVCVYILETLGTCIQASKHSSATMDSGHNASNWRSNRDREEMTVSATKRE